MLPAGTPACRPRSIGRRQARRLKCCARTSSAASKLAAHRAMPSRPISTRTASRHRMATNGSIEPAGVSAYDRPAGYFFGRESFFAGPGVGLSMAESIRPLSLISLNYSRQFILYPQLHPHLEGSNSWHILLRLGPSSTARSRTCKLTCWNDAASCCVVAIENSRAWDSIFSPSPMLLSH
jgi:hypothetical protein